MRPVLLIPDLALERWSSMDRYAGALAARLRDVEVPREARLIGGPRYLARYFRYPRALRRYRPKLVHVLDHSYAHCLSAFPGLPSVVTIHDLYPVRVLAEGGSSLRAALRDRLLRWVMAWIGRASRWVAVSAFTANEAERLLGLARERIAVVPNGVDEVFFGRLHEETIAARRAGWAARLPSSGGHTRVLLHVGNCSPRKNVEAAIRAVGLLRRRGVDVCLMQIGGRFEATHLRLIRAGGAGAYVIQEPFADEAALVAAYHAADVTVLPSRYEGFGLPALEAMAAGLPVVTSGTGGLREVVADAAL
ncbi:MAG: glycosyltransferase, partial [Gemmatimonadetes bacterium]|nr:glycosyltransferase [Gemmatimonadota bacterium]